MILLGSLALSYMLAEDPLEKRIFRLLAYLGRYGHQSASALLDFSVRDLMQLADHVSEMVKAESENAREP